MAKERFDEETLEKYRVIAHRGLHSKTVSENSLKAFGLAIEKGLAFELDCHLSLDGRLIVCHDSDLERVTGKKGYIPDLTLEQIKGEYHLLDGQEIPTLEEVLELNEERSPVVLELKVDDKDDVPLALTALEAIKGLKDKSNLSIISFFPKALLLCKGYGFSRGLLIYKGKPIVKRLSFLFDYLDVEDCLLDDPYYAKYRRKGGLINTWTIERKEQLEAIKGKVDMITFQHLEVEEVKEAL